MSYTQLAHEERYQIYILRKAGLTQSGIASVLNRHKSTISRELSRNRGGRGYRPKQAHCRALERRQSRCLQRIGETVWAEVDRLLRRDWSPEQIGGRLHREHGVSVSHEWIYQHVYHDKRAGGRLFRHLRCQKKRRKRYGTYSRRGRIPNQVSIDQRPAAVNHRKRVGDWEGDTVIGRGHKGALVTLVERKARFTLIQSVPQKTAEHVRRAVRQQLNRHRSRVHSITYDNGREFADHEGMADDLDTAIYFAHPYASWERGANENTNGLIRQYLPKHRRLDNVSDSQIQRIVNWLNNRPRKVLGYRTPHEVFFNTTSKLTVALES